MVNSLQIHSVEEALIEKGNNFKDDDKLCFNIWSGIKQAICTQSLYITITYKDQLRKIGIIRSEYLVNMSKTLKL